MASCRGSTPMVPMLASKAAPRQPRAPRRPISRAMIEVVASRSVAVFGLAFGAQTVPVALDQLQYSRPLWSLLVLGGLGLGLVASVVASVVKRWVRTANSFVLGMFLVALITWPIGLDGDTGQSADRPWVWFLITVATAAATIALPVWLATFYLLLAPLLYGIIRSSAFGGGLHPALVSFDVIYAVILGGAVLIIITMLRGAAAAVDAAQGTALARYVDAVRAHATEVERVQVDSIVHDSVLTTLLSAAKAREPDSMALATTMARNAIGHLQREATTSTVEAAAASASSLANRVASAAATLSSIINVRRSPLGSRTVPAAVAEALYSASLQAMVNSLQHAGDSEDVAHWVGVHPLADDGLFIEIGDTGCGFDVTEIPVERLGLRVSIIERVSNSGGTVEVDSSLGVGTTIRLTWLPKREDEADHPELLAGEAT